MYNLRSWQRRCLREIHATILKAPQLPTGLGPTGGVTEMARIARYWHAVEREAQVVVEVFLYPDAPREAAEEAARDLAQRRDKWLEENDG